MKLIVHRPDPIRRFLQRLPATRPGAWFFARTSHHLDRWTLQLSGGRYTLANLLTGIPVLTLTTTGARSGQPRSVPLLGFPDGERIVLVASNFGQAHYPAWYHNLRA